jgi:uncharacterized SAM-binding protein YcdF (DUF218 family)
MSLRPFFIMILLAALTYQFIFKNLGPFLVRDDKPQNPTPFGLILMGDVATRTPEALRLLQSGKVAQFVFFEAESFLIHRLGLIPQDGRLTEDFLLRLGAKEEQMLYQEGHQNTSTRDEARAIANFLRGIRPIPKRLIVVTSWYHTSRAGYILDRSLKPLGINVEMVPAYGDEKDVADVWWKSERSLIAVFNEYLKWIYYLFTW